jgi:hypothetical protein
MLPVFHKELEMFVALVGTHSEQIVMDTVRYLLRHWPEREAQKMGCFVVSLTGAVSRLPPDRRTEVARPLFHRFAQSIECDHSVISVATLKLLGSAQLWQWFGDAEHLAAIVAAAVREASQSWSEQVREVAGPVIARMTEVGQPNALQPRAAEWERKWKAIRESAIDSCPELAKADLGGSVYCEAVPVDDRI